MGNKLNKFQGGKIKMAEDSCIYPKCPKCNKGYLVPFSFKNDVYEKWKCTSPDCDYVLQKRE